MAKRPRREPARGSPPTRDVHVDLVIVLSADGRFVVASDGTRPRCPRVELTSAWLGAETFGALVEARAKRDLDLRLSYLGLLSFKPTPMAYELVAAAVVRPPTAIPRDLHLMTLHQLRGSALRRDMLEHFTAAEHRRAAEEDAGALAADIKAATERSLDFLRRHLSQENDQTVGYSQYLDGRSVGLLSTAQGVLAYVHAGRRDGVDQRVVATLQARQNPDGGWPVRRALVGNISDRSLTESTCFCLWALCELKGSESDDAVSRGVAWLEGTQADEGGWRPSARGDVQVSATATSVRTLAALGRAETASVRRGVDWLRRAQQDDGGWSETIPRRESPGASSQPAFTALAMVALLTAGVAPSERTIRDGSRYLLDAFHPDDDEPWAPTLTSVVVDEATGARLEFRHYATPWALAALSLAGDGLDEPVVLAGIRKLLRLQERGGAWRCGLTAAGAATVWALHDALYALRTTLSISSRDLAPVAMAGHWSRERAVLHEAILGLLGARSGLYQPTLRWRWGRNVWLSFLVVAGALAAGSQVGLFRAFSSGTDLRFVAAVAAAAISTFGAVAPLVFVEEYKLWRMRRTSSLQPER